MTEGTFFNGPRVAPNRLWTAVVPTATAAAVMQVAPLITVWDFARTVLAPRLNAVSPGMQISVSNTAWKRSVFLALRSETALIATAPAAVQTLATGLLSCSDQSYSHWGDKGTDVWILGNSTMALSHGGYSLLNRLGFRFLRPDPTCYIPSRRGSLEIVANEIYSPVVKSFSWGPQGGLGSPALPVGLPGRAASVDNWQLWRQQTCNPSEILGGYSDGGEGPTADRRQEYDGDHTTLAWVGGSINKRGYSDTGAWTGSCSVISLAKLCMSHHGASGTGSLPAAPAGPSPWISIAAAMWRETCSVNSPAWPITPDPGPDTATNPSPNYTAFNGGVRIFAEHAVGSISQRLVTYGPNHPLTRAFSVSPNDGQYFCQCANCINMLRNGPYAAYLTPLQQTQDATDSDKCAHFLNWVCFYADRMFANALDDKGLPYIPMCGITGYVSHTVPPSIPIHANSLWVILYTSAITNGVLASEIFDQWKDKRATNPWGPFTIGTYPQWLTDDTSFSAPKWPSPKIAALMLRDWIAKGYHFIGGETGASHWVQGLQLRLFSAMCWDPNLDIDAFIDEDFQLMFGPAAAAARALYERWWQFYEHCPQEIAMSMRGVQAVQDALDAAPDPVLPDGRAAVQTRITSFKLFVEWQRRYAEYFAALRDYETGKLTAGGGATAAVKLATHRLGTEPAFVPSIIRIEIDGSGTFRWTKNADHPTIKWEASGVPIPTTGPRTITLGTDRSAMFPAGTYSVGHFWTEVPNIAPLETAVDRLFDLAWRASSTNGLHTIRYAGGPVNGRPFNRISHPFSNSSDGSSPPALTVQRLDVLAAIGVTAVPLPGVTRVDLRCTTGGLLNTAVLEYQVNGTGAWTSFTTPASANTNVTLALAGVVIKCGAGTYNTDNRWYMTFSPNLSKWNWTDAGAVAGGGAGWADMVVPPKATVDALIADGIATYTPAAGVTRLIYDTTSFQPFNVSAATTIHYGPWFQFPQRWAIHKASGAVTLKLKTFQPGAPGLNIRVILSDIITGAKLQEWSFASPAPGATITNDVVIGATAGVAAGNYFVTVVDCTATQTSSQLGIPENTGAVLSNDWLDAIAAPTQSSSITAPLYFRVEPGLTKVVGAFAQAPGEGPNVFDPIQVFDPTGAPVTMTYGRPNQFSFNVGAGQDNMAWSFTGFMALDNKRIMYLENCCNRFAPSPYQILIH